MAVVFAAAKHQAENARIVAESEIAGDFARMGQRPEVNEGEPFRPEGERGRRGDGLPEDEPGAEGLFLLISVENRLGALDVKGAILGVLDQFVGDDGAAPLPRLVVILVVLDRVPAKVEALIPSKSAFGGVESMAIEGVDFERFPRAARALAYAIGREDLIGELGKGEIPVFPILNSSGHSWVKKAFGA